MVKIEIYCDYNQSMTDFIGEHDQETQQDFKMDKIPFNLQEFGEVPKDYVPVYVVVRKESLQWIADHGLRADDNQMDEKTGEFEKLFDVAQRPAGVTVDRGVCVFAYPMKQADMKSSMGFDPESQVMLECMIDPNDRGTWVVEGEYYTEAGAEFNGYKQQQGSLNSVKSWIESYWNSAVRFSDYLRSRSRGEDYFNFPEVLIPYDIPTKMIKVVPNTRSEEEEEK